MLTYLLTLVEDVHPQPKPLDLSLKSHKGLFGPNDVSGFVAFEDLYGDK